MVSAEDSIIVSLKNSIITKINNVVGSHNVSNIAHLDIRDSLDNKANSSHTHTNSDITDLFNAIYPVGSIYISVNNTSPSTLFGGTWEQLTETFLYASTTADVNSTTATGGEATHTLTINEIPSHKHQTSVLARYTTTSSANALVGYDSKTSHQNTSSVGGGQPHNNMPPYMKVFMWKRTA